MYVCIMYVRTHVHTDKLSNVQMFKLSSICIYLLMYMCVYIHIDVYTYIYTPYIYICKHIPIYLWVGGNMGRK